MWDWILFVLLLFFTGWALQTWVVSPILVASASPSASEAAATSTNPNSPSPAPSDPRTYTPQSWCLVGENTLGRLCVQSPRCGPLETYPSREACELVEASALPLGITGQGGLVYTPFLTPRLAQLHTF